MSEYLAKFSGTAVEYSFGGNKTYSFSREKRFSAKDDELAKRIAEDQKLEMVGNLLGAKISLESVLEVRDVDLN